MSGFSLTTAAIDIAALCESLAEPRAGAIAGFEGRVRNHHAGRAVAGLAYEAYGPLAEREGVRILSEARERFAITGIVAQHRLGGLAIGEVAVYVAAAAAHRDAAFDACRFAIDEIKRRVPIWKHERYADGTQAWIHPEN